MRAEILLLCCVLFLFVITFLPFLVIGSTSGGGDFNAGFLDLNDAPSATYVGQAGNAPRVNALETGLEWFTPSGASYSDLNRTQVSLTDTNSGYLNSEIIAGTNITLSQIDAGGGDIKLQINSTASGGTGTSCDRNESCTFWGDINAPAHDMNINDINSTGNARIAGNLTVVSQSNLSTTVPSSNNSITLGTNNLRWATFFTRDINSFGVAGFNKGNFVDLNSTTFQSKNGNILNDLNVLHDINAGNILYAPQICLNGDCKTVWPTEGGGGGYTSGTPSTIQVNNDNNTISQNFDGNFWFRFTPANDGNFWTRFQPAFDGNFYFKNSGDINWITFNQYFNPSGNGVPDTNILNATRYKQDSSCDQNSLCRLLSSTILWDSNAVLDGRYALAGSTGITWTELNNIIPWQDVNVDNGITLTNLTQIITRSYTDLQNKPDIPTDSTIDANVEAILALRVPWTDGNVADTITVINYLRNDYLGNLFPVPDVNVVDALTINTTIGARFKDINFTGVLSGGDFNFGLGDANGSQSCGANLGLNIVGASTGCISIPSESNIDGNFYSQFVVPFDSNFFFRNAGDMNWITFNTYVNPAGGIVDANIANDLTIASTKNGSFSLDLNVGRKINTFDLNVGHDVNVHNNVKIDNNLLVSKDLNVSNQAGFDKNISMNTLGGAVKFKTNTIQFCIYGNNFDSNGGLVFGAC